MVFNSNTLFSWTWGVGCNCKTLKGQFRGKVRHLMKILINVFQYISLFWYYEKGFFQSRKAFKEHCALPFLDFCQDFQVKDQQTRQSACLRIKSTLRRKHIPLIYIKIIASFSLTNQLDLDKTSIGDPDPDLVRILGFDDKKW